jgi:hypothetical protein
VNFKINSLVVGIFFQGSFNFVSSLVLRVAPQNYLSQKFVPLYSDCDLDFDTVLSWR